MKSLVVDISSLGLGHLSQIAPVLDRVHTHIPNLRIIVRTNHKSDQLKQFLKSEIDLDAPVKDAEIFTDGPYKYDIQKTTRSFLSLHSRWLDTVRIESFRLADLNPCLVLSNVSYLSLAAAAEIGVPSFCLCSINWLDFVDAYLPSTEKIYRMKSIINRAYCLADVFLQPRPHMPMRYLPNRLSIGPIARTGVKMSGTLREQLRIDRSTKLVLVTFGGVDLKSIPEMPIIENVVWIIQCTRKLNRPDVIPLAELDFSFIDVLASVDLIVGKDSYGVVAESACNGVRLMVLPREGSMEARSLLDWATSAGGAASFHGQIDSPSFVEAVCRSLEQPKPERVEASGVDEAAWLIAEKIVSEGA